MALWLQAKNNASSMLADSMTSIDTSLAVKTGEGERFPSDFPFHITVEDEIMECTGREGDILYVARAQENTETAGHAANAAVRLNLTAATIDQIQAEIDAKIPLSLLDSRGGILTATGDDSPCCLPPGSDGQILRARPAEPTGLKWENFPAGSASISSGTYTGNSTSNRAVPHGMANVPRLVIIQNQTDTTMLLFYVIFPGFGYILGLQLSSGTWLSESTIANLAVTPMDASNFYVGHIGAYVTTANMSGKVYRWVAMY